MSTSAELLVDANNQQQKSTSVDRQTCVAGAACTASVTMPDSVSMPDTVSSGLVFTARTAEISTSHCASMTSI